LVKKEENCLYFSKGVFKIYEKVCGFKSINFEQKSQRIKVKVGGIVIAIGAEFLILLKFLNLHSVNLN